MMKRMPMANRVALLALAACLLAASGCKLSLQDEMNTARGLPVFPGAVRTGEFSTTWPDSKPSAGLTFSVSATAPQILSFYRAAMADAGWALQATEDASGLDERGALMFAKGRSHCDISVRGRSEPFAVTLRVTSD
jgi:hypothetical protein